MARAMTLALLLGVSLLALASGADAQRRAPRQGATEAPTEDTPSPEALERARQLFERGLASLERQRWDEARVLFEEAWSLAPRPSILVNLGTAQRQSGRLVEARESYRTFLERFPTHELTAQTRQSLAEVETLMPQVTIHVEGLQPGDEVFLDEDPVQTLDAPFAANPGLRQVSVWRGGRSLQSVRVRVELEGDEEVFLRAIDLSPSTVAAGEVGTTGGATMPVTPPPGDDTPLIVGLVIGAVVVVGAAVAVGVVLGTQDTPRVAVAPTIRGGVLLFE
jgi:tetratricopeptide (TPR) repeat protein